MRPHAIILLGSFMYKRSFAFIGQWFPSRPARFLIFKPITFGHLYQTKQHDCLTNRIPGRLPSRTKNALRSSSSSLNIEDSFQETLWNGILPRISPPRTADGDVLHHIIVLGVSGGCDSVALFHLLRQQVTQRKIIGRSNNEIHMHVVHFDHQQRGISSDMDRELVQELCHRYGVPLTCYFWNDYEDAADLFSQASARDWRQVTMSKLLGILMKQFAESQNVHSDSVVGMIMTAHHRDDSNETLWLKFLRGTYITHLQGMSIVSPIADSDQTGNAQSPNLIFLVRPLLHVCKKKIVNYLRANDYEWREDESNQSSKYLRNRVRNELLPLLEDLAGGPDALQQRIDHLSKQSQELDQYLIARANDLVEAYDGEGDESYFTLPANEPEIMTVVHKQALVLWVQERSKGNCFLDYGSLERVINQLFKYPNKTQWRINISGGWDIVRQGNVLVLENAAKIPAETHRLDQYQKILAWRLEDSSSKLSNEDRFVRVCQPADMVTENSEFVLTTVGFNPKVLFTPPWRQGRKPVPITEFLRGQKIPLHERSKAPIVICRAGFEKRDSVVVAVYVSSQDEWIPNSIHEPGSGDEVIEIKLV